MIMVLWSVLLLLFILPLLLYFRVTIKASLVSAEPDKLFQMNIVSNFGIIQKDFCYSFEDILSLVSGSKSDNAAPKPGLATRLVQFPQQISTKLHNFKNNLFLSSRIFRWLVIEKIEWKTRAGSDDAMDTAILTGFLWSFQGSLISAISSRSRLQQLTLNNEPDFNKPGINSYLVCILKMRIVHIIIITSLVLALKVRGYLNGCSK